MIPYLAQATTSSKTKVHEGHYDTHKTMASGTPMPTPVPSTRTVIEQTGSVSPLPGRDPRLADTFRHLITALDRSNVIMEGCANAVVSLSDRINSDKPPSKQYLGDRKDKVTVELKCAFLKIIDIETLDQIFEAEIFIQARWMEPALKDFTEKDMQDYDPANYWIPKLSIMNTDGELEWNRRSFTVQLKEPGYTYPIVLLLWRFKGKFRENLELEHFPFDVQDLTVQVTTERSSSEVELIEDQHSLCTVNIKTFQDAQEWSIYEHVETFRDQTTQEYVSSTIHPILFIQCRVKRKIGYFMWNIVFIVALITCLTFSMITLEPENVDRMYNNVTLLLTASIFKMVIQQSLPTISYLTYLLLIIALTFTTLPIDPFNADRMSVTITLFLTSVAFKLVVKQSLPTISYLTYLDIYVLATLVFLGLQIAENAVMAGLCKIMSKTEVYEWDRYAIVSLAIVLFLFHIMFMIHIYLTAYRRRRLMKQKDRLYQAKKKHLEKYGSMMPTKEPTLSIKMNQAKNFK